ncbi:TPA: hypothetical protein DEP58_00615 [Patescibacteria group bacterium]|nr:MAG: hypothetical protein UU98_C0032G0007 [Parcubacteria group bacterium GW2011_GWD2_42_14]HCC04791.1 hypothetical protein [Patescibacteria group bacterium]
MTTCDEDVTRFLCYEGEKFVPLKSVPGLPCDLLESWKALGFDEGYIDKSTEHLLLRKKGGEQILRHIGSGEWIQVHPPEEAPRKQSIIF